MLLHSRSTDAAALSKGSKEEASCSISSWCVLQPQYGYAQEQKAVMSGSCVECERTAAMRQKKELECDGSIRPGDVFGVRLQIRAAAAAAVQLKSNQRSSKMRCFKMRLVPKRSERSRKKAGERGRRGALKEQKGRKGKDAGCSSLSGAAFRV